ncbi:hypothetical protein F5X97DRAFT_320163 [Nemania serpens]|nr:hypothetical protein F5X97DRAFT_320163 [Nemania serpens]
MPGIRSKTGLLNQKTNTVEMMRHESHDSLLRTDGHIEDYHERFCVCHQRYQEERLVRRRPRGGCCEVYIRDIRRPLPNNFMKTKKSLDSTGRLWWRVRELESETLESSADFASVTEEPRIPTATMLNPNPNRRTHGRVLASYYASSSSLRPW